MSPARVQRVGDAERDAAVSSLTAHFVAGRLTKDELDERLGRALTARTDTDLATLLADLPAPATQSAARPHPRSVPGRRPPAHHWHGWHRPLAPVLVLLVIGIIALPGPPIPLIFLFWFWIMGGSGRFHRRWPPPHRMV